MKKIIKFNEELLNYTNKSLSDRVTVKSLLHNNISIEVSILDEDIKIILTLLYSELKKINDDYTIACNKKEKTQICYWVNIKNTFTCLINKLGNIKNIDEIHTFSLIEINCILGVMEETLQKIVFNKVLYNREENPEYKDRLINLYRYFSTNYKENLDLVKTKSEILNINQL
ncbi:MAG: hypothetical protein K0R54_148 [Clostridiaceae bacterium]|jgi:hypothetical protein|nr:hypothetical protein [Clostridiaceae bacterium]